MSEPDKPNEARLHQAAKLIDERLRPAAVLLYGSVAEGRMRADSDVDIAVLVGAAPPDPFAIARLRTDVEAVLGRNADLVILDTASPILAMEVLRRHRTLACRDEALLRGFVVKTLGAYFDLKMTRRPIERALRRETPRV
jgi:predicted nucleotidyltransferase